MSIEVMAAIASIADSLRAVTWLAVFWTLVLFGEKLFRLMIGGK